jgi:hypothetical protein
MDSREDFDTQPKVPIDASTDSREDFDVHGESLPFEARIFSEKT